MIELRELQWGHAGDAGARLTATLAKGACAVLEAPERDARTVLAVISGRMAPISGRVVLDGHDLTHDPLARRRLVFCAHDLPHLPVRVGEYLALAAAGRTGLGGAPAAALRASGYDAAADAAGLDAAARQTLDLAAALASGAPILLAHAPFASGTADDHARRRALLAEARHEGRTVIVTGISRRDALVDTVLEAGR
ncbi:MAG: hypothetical protein AB7I25_08020 [Vicinamibacterales bacterium]